MEFFQNAKAVRLQSHLGKYLVADEDEESVRQSPNGTSRKARWTVEFVDGKSNAIRLKSCHGLYLTAAKESFLLGATGKKVLQTLPAKLEAAGNTEWEPVKEGMNVKLMGGDGKFLRANWGPPPYRNSVTYDIPYQTKTQDWTLWGVDVVDITLSGLSDTESVSGSSMSMLSRSRFSSVRDDYLHSPETRWAEAFGVSGRTVSRMFAERTQLRKKMASSVINCIDDALLKVDWLVERAGYIHEHKMFKVLRFRLRNLGTFVLISSTKLGDDDRLGPFLERIKDIVGRNAAEIQHHIDLSSGSPDIRLDMGVASEFRKDIQFLGKDMDEWYTAMMDSRQWSALVTEQVLEILRSVLLNLEDFQSFRSTILHAEILGEAMEKLGDHVKFLESLICFAARPKLISDELPQNSLARAEAAAIKFAHLLFTCRVDKFDAETGKRMHHSISMLLQMIKPVDPQVSDAYTQVLINFKLSRGLMLPTIKMDDDALIAMKNFLDALISVLWDILRVGSSSADPLKELYGGLRSLRTFLKQQRSRLGVNLNEDIEVVVCDAGVLICSLHRTDIDVYLEVSNMVTNIAGIQEQVGGMQGEIAEEENKIHRHDLSPKVPSISDDEFVGFQDDLTSSILDRLCRGPKRLQIVTIAGMAGSGKTTLAAKIYNQASVKYHFQLSAWCYISPVLNKEKVLLDLLNQVDPGISSSNDLKDMSARSLRRYAASYTTIEDLENMLRRGLRRKRYLIVLDDILDAKSWDDLWPLFPDDNSGSRILITSRNSDVVHFRTDQELYNVRPLDINESLKLFQQKFSPQSKWLGAPLDLQMQIVEKCQGLPLTIVIVAGLLANIEPMGWEGVLDDLNSHVIRSTNVFELSYKHLPDFLKPCLLYFGALPYGEEVSVRRLVRLWMAEGFVQKHDRESQENVAERYLDNLISRSLIMVSKERSIGGVKACRIHDLLHAFCVQKAKDEHFFHFLKGHDELSSFNEPRNLRRLCILSEPKHFKESKLFCPRARSLLFNMSQRVHRAEVQLDISFIIHIFKLLRVLDLQQISLDSGLPSEISLLVQLAFLAIRGKMRLIPSSIANLSYLETLIVDAGRHVLSLPDGLWNLQKLEYVYIKSFENFGGGCMSIQNVHSLQLDRFSGAVFPSWGSMDKMMKMFPNIRKLKCMLNFELGDDANNHDYNNIDLDFLCQLESLHISPYGGLPFDGMFVFSMPSSLKKLTLSHFYLTWSNMSTIGKLPHLEVFKLLHIIFERETWDMVEGEFSKLRTLTLSSCLGLIAWKSGDFELPCLKKLVLNECEYLEELPDCVEYSCMLEMIEISNCPEGLADSVRRIVESQREYGNSIIQYFVRRIVESQRRSGNSSIQSSEEFSVTP